MKNNELLAPPPVLELDNVCRVFGATIRAVDDVSLKISAGEIVSILGPSGCGKTTTMRMIAGLDHPTSGDIRVQGRSVLHQAPHVRNIGLVFQSLAVFPHMDVRGNVAFGLRMKGVETTTAQAKVRAALDVVQLPFHDYGSRMPRELSGGQLQRVALARTLVTEPALVLFDEPMAALDRRLRDHMAVELRRIQKTLGIAAVYVTHDQETASAMSDRIVVMNNGRIVQTGTTEDIYNRPADRFVAEFLGDMNFLSVEETGPAIGGEMPVKVADGIITVRAAELKLPGSTVVMIRPERIDLVPVSQADGPMAEVTEVTFNAGFYRVRLRLKDGQTLQVLTQDNAAIGGGPGTKVRVAVAPGAARIASA